MPDTITAEIDLTEGTLAPTRAFEPRELVRLMALLTGATRDSVLEYLAAIDERLAGEQSLEA